MNDQQMDWARRKDREAEWAKLVTRNHELHAAKRFWKGMFYGCNVVTWGLIIAIVLLLVGG